MRLIAVVTLTLPWLSSAMTSCSLCSRCCNCCILSFICCISSSLLGSGGGAAAVTSWVTVAIIPGFGWTELHLRCSSLSASKSCCSCDSCSRRKLLSARLSAVSYKDEVRDMDTLITLLALCEGNPPVTGGIPLQRVSNAEIWGSGYGFKKPDLEMGHPDVMWHLLCSRIGAYCYI